MDVRIVELPHFRALVLRVPGLGFIAEGKDTFFGTGFFFVPAATAKSSGEAVFVQGLLEGLCLHDVCIGCAIVEGIDALFDAFLIDIFDELQAVLLHGFIAEADHFLELPRRIDMEERERRFFRIKGLQSQVKHDRTVFADGIEHDRLFTFRSDFADDVNRFGL